MVKCTSDIVFSFHRAQSEKYSLLFTIAVSVTFFDN